PADGPTRDAPAEPALTRAAEDARVVTLRLRPAARWVAEYYSVLATRELPEGELEVDLQFFDDRWLNRLLLRLAPWASVVAHPGSLDPEPFTLRFMTTAQDALSLYGEDA
ncbi:MAG: WYL domain-containing protein, partial [Nocardioides sp.]